MRTAFEGGGHGKILTPAQLVGEGQLPLFVREMDCEGGRVRQGKLQTMQFGSGKNQREWRIGI